MNYDLGIIGAGSAAFAAALEASDNGLRVLMVNSGLPLGGTCVNVGCLPSKFLIRAAEAFEQALHPRFDAVHVGKSTLDFKSLIEQKRQMVARMRAHKYIDLLKDRGNITVVEGFGVLVDPHTIRTERETFTAENIVIASGATTRIPPILGLNSVQFLTNETLFELEELPRKLLIIGGGYIGLEAAQAYRRFGSDVQIIEAADRVLSTDDPEISEELTHYLQQEGVGIHTGVTIQALSSNNGTTAITGILHDAQVQWEGTHVFLATGRRPNTMGMGLDRLGILTTSGHVQVDEHMRTSIPNIYAAGDCTPKPEFVYTAAHEGKVAVSNMLGKNSSIDLSALPWVVFTDPQISGIGIYDAEAEKKGLNIEVSRLPMAEVARSVAANDTRGFIKLIRNADTDELLGARIVAADGGELISELALAMKYHIHVNDLAETLHPYLTSGEGIRLAAIGFAKDVATLSCCAA